LKHPLRKKKKFRGGKKVLSENAGPGSRKRRVGYASADAVEEKRGISFLEYEKRGTTQRGARRVNELQSWGWELNGAARIRNLSKRSIERLLDHKRGDPARGCSRVVTLNL